MPETTQSPPCGKCGAALSGFAPDRLCAACLLESAFGEPEDLVSEPAQAAPLLSFGDYEVLEEIARGGMGVVYRARQISLNRPVALKMMLGGHLATAAEKQRFRAEAGTAAQLQHPNIVAIHEVGEHAAQPFFSMDLVNGRNLAQLVGDEPLPARKAAGYLKAIAEAVQYAHSRGVLHRDLKPSNILIDDSDQPRITDFGLAKRFDDAQHSSHDAQLTLTGQVLGSPSFIPPEQAAGRKQAIGPASDVYSLGAILYQCLTARPPFAAESLTQTLRMVAENEPVSPRLLNTGVPRDLETICLKCLEKVPQRRYGAAQELADELGRFLRLEPIRARPVGAVLRVRRWCRRNPALASVSAVAVVLLMAVASLATVALMQSEHAQSLKMEKARAGFLTEAKGILLSDSSSRRYDALELLARAATVRPDIDLRNEAMGALALPSFRVFRQWTNLSSLPVLDFDSTYEHYAQRNDDHIAAIHRAADDIKTGGAAGLGGPLHLVRFSPDGRWLALARGTPQRWLRVFDLASGRFAFSEKCEFDILDFSGDSRRIAVVRVGGMTTVYELSSGRELMSRMVTPPPLAVRLNRDGTILATVGPSGSEVCLYDCTTGQLTLSIANSRNVNDAAWHPDNNALVLAGEDGWIRSWDTVAKDYRTSVARQASAILHITISDDGRLAAVWCQDGSLRIVEAETMKELFRTPAASGFWSRFGREDTRLAYRTASGNLEVLEIDPGRECRTFAFGRAITRCAFAGDGQTVRTLGRDGLQMWDSVTGRQIAPGSAKLLTSLDDETAGPFDERVEFPSASNFRATSGDGRIAVARQSLRTVRLARARDDSELGRFNSTDPSGIEWLALNSDGSRLAIATKSGALEIWDLKAIRSGLARLGLDWE